MCRKHLILLILISSLTLVLSAALPEIYFTIPSEETEHSVSISPYRFAGYTRNADELTMNDEPLEIFSTGAFAGRFHLEEGKNEFIFQASNEQGIVTRVVTVDYSPPPDRELPEEDMYIWDREMKPQENMTLTTGDRLEVQCRATPGEELQFKIDGLTGYMAMKEIPEDVAGKKGLYQGRYTIQDDDKVEEAEIIFRLRKGLFRSLDATADGKVTITDQFPRTGVINSDLTSVRSGRGEARLGGARMFYGHEGQHVVVTGKIGNLYRVALSSDRTAWISQNDIDLLSPHKALPYNLIGNYSLEKDEHSDYISIPLTYKVPYDIYTDGNALIADIYYSASNTTWVTDRLNSEIIKKVSWYQVEEDVYRLRIDLKDNLWGYFGEFNNNRLKIGVKRPPQVSSNRDNRLDGMTITIDPGHMGPREDPGAIGSLGTKEKNVALAVSEFLQEELKKAGADVIMTREGQSTVTWNERRESILNHEADMWISIHANSIGMASNPLGVSGTSTYYRHPFNHDFSEAVLKRLLDLGLNNFGNISSFNFSPLQLTHCPTLLVETAFMSNPEDEAKLIDPEWQKKMARAITDGVIDYMEKYISEK